MSTRDRLCLDAGKALSPFLTPDSIAWDRSSDPRLYLIAVYGLMLQVAHPTVGAGVRDHSKFDTETWNRLLYTGDYVMLSVYGGDETATLNRRLRKVHTQIKGIGFDGRPYNAFEREAWAWVHGSLGYAIVVGHNHFGRPLSPQQTERFYREWRRIGGLIGVREEDLPADWAGFCTWFDHIVAERLTHNETVERLKRALYTEYSPVQVLMPDSPLRVLVDPLWRNAATHIHGHVHELATVGLLPPVLRERFGMRWSASQEAEFQLLGAVLRVLTPVLPRRLRIAGPDWLRVRRNAIAGSRLGTGTPTPAYGGCPTRATAPVGCPAHTSAA